MNSKSLSKLYLVFVFITLIIFAFVAPKEFSHINMKILIPYINYNKIFLHLYILIAFMMILTIYFLLTNHVIRWDNVTTLLAIRCILNLLPLINPEFNTSSFWGYYLNTVVSFAMYFIFLQHRGSSNKIITLLIIFGLILSIQMIWAATIIELPFSDVRYKNYLRIPFGASSYIASGILAIFFLLLYSDIKQPKKILLASFLLVGFILGRSRGGYFIFAFFFIMTFINYTKSKKISKLGIFLIYSLILAVIIIVIATPQIRNIFIGYAKVDNITLNGLTSGRLKLYIHEIQSGLDNFIFGRGLSYNEVAYAGAHNLIIDLFAQNGIIGLIIYIIALFHVLKNVRKLGKQSTTIRACSIFLCVSLAYSMIETVYFNYVSDSIFWMVAGLLVAEKNRLQRLFLERETIYVK